MNGAFHFIPSTIEPLQTHGLTIFANLQRKMAAPMQKKFFWPAIEENKVRTDVTVIDSKIIYMQPDMQVWKVMIEPGEIWIGMNDNHNEMNEIYVELQKDADSQWKMDHILTDIEYESLLKEVEVE